MQIDPKIAVPKRPQPKVRTASFDCVKFSVQECWTSCRVLQLDQKIRNLQTACLTTTPKRTFDLNEPAYFKRCPSSVETSSNVSGLHAVKASILSVICKALAISRRTKRKFSILREWSKVPFPAKGGEVLRSKDPNSTTIFDICRDSMLAAQNNIVGLIAAPSCLSRQNAHSKTNSTSEGSSYTR